MLKKSFIIGVLTVFFSVSGTAGSAVSGTVFDIQCGCYQNRENVEILAHRLNELELPWYRIPMGRCTRLILDANVAFDELSSFTARYPEFADAFLVKNFWDIPHPDPEKISPLPTREMFAAVMVPYMQQEYKRGYYNSRRLSMAKEQAEMYAGFIYDASSYYGLDPFLLLAIGNFETYFRNMYGDLDRLKHKSPDPAQGMFQILTSTSRYIYRDMKKKKEPHTPAALPSNLLTHPKTQVYFAAHYLHKLKHEQYNNRYMAVLAYNSSSMCNFDYVRRVMKCYQRALSHFTESSRRYEAKVTLPATLPVEDLPKPTIARIVQ